MYDAPYPADGRTHEALFEIAPDELEQQGAPDNQISQKMFPGDAAGHSQPRIISIFSTTCNA
jgi:hypothetical protein